MKWQSLILPVSEAMLRMLRGTLGNLWSHVLSAKVLLITIRNLHNSYNCSSVCNLLIFFIAFKIFYLSYVFSNLTIMHLVMIFFVLPWLGFIELRSATVCFLLYFGNLKALIFKFFSLLHCLSSFTRFQLYACCCLKLYYRKLRIWSFLKLLFSLPFRF